MSLASYSPTYKPKQFACVEVNMASVLSGAWAAFGAGVQGTFSNAIGENFVVTVTPSAGGSITPAGPTFNMSGGVATYTVTITFDRKYSGAISFITQNWDNNNLSGIDKICTPSIGFPDSFPSDLQNIGGCLYPTLNANPVTPRTITWSEVDQVTSFTFVFNRTSLASALNVGINLVEKSIQKWERRDVGNGIIWYNPLTNTTYVTNLPANVKEVNCLEDDKLVFYTEELCYGVVNPISFNVSAVPGMPLDAYNGIAPRLDGIPPLSFTPPGGLIFEFNQDGTRLYNITGATFHTNTYNSALLQTGLTSVGLNFLGFPAAVGYNAVGLTVHPETGIVYVLYIDPGTRRLYLAKIINNIVTLVGDTQYNPTISPVFDGHDIVFTKSGQILYGHGQNLFLLDATTGIITVGNPIPLKPIGTATFAIRQLSRYYSGDLHVAGTDASVGSFVMIVDGESYQTKSVWYNGNSPTPPPSPITIAFPQNPKIKFKRLYTKNVETQGEQYEDRDIVTGQILTLPNPASITKCIDDTPLHTSWTETVCYTIDKNITSVGILEIANTGQIVSTAPCTAIAGFIAPAPLIYSSVTHDVTGNNLYALAAGANQLDTYKWAVKNNPVLSASVPITGYIAGGETEKSLRTRWSDNTLWLMTEIIVGVNRLFRFYIVNKTTGVLTLQGTATYPAGLNANGRFCWGVDDELYFSAVITGTTYGIHRLSKITYNTQYLISSHNYVIINLNVDLPNQRLIVGRNADGLDFYSYTGQFLESCGVGASNFLDAIYGALGTFTPGDTTYRIKRIFIKNLTTLATSSYYQDPVTGQDFQLPPLARLVPCDTSIIIASKPIPRFRVISGINKWQKSIDAPNAKSVSITRLTNNITINDGFGVFNINAAFTTSWLSEGGLGGDLIISGTAAGSNFTVTWLE